MRRRRRRRRRQRMRMQRRRSRGGIFDLLIRDFMPKKLISKDGNVPPFVSMRSCLFYIYNRLTFNS